MVNRDSDVIRNSLCYNVVSMSAIVIRPNRQQSIDWNGLGKLALVGLGIYVAVKVLRDPGLRAELAAAFQKAQRQQELERQRQRLEQIRAAIETAFKPTPIEPVASSLNSGLLVPGRALVAAEPDARWRQVIIHPSVVLVLGKRGSGKSAWGYRLLELFRYGPRPYVVGVPGAARSLFPDWIGIAPTLEEVPPKAVALVDEAYLRYHARGSMAQESKAMSQMLNLSRQREQTIIFVTQEARQVDRTIASSANVVVFKDLGMLQLEFDRPELNKLAAQAREAFSTVKGDRRRWAFVYAPDSDFTGLLENYLPTFWKPALSRLFAAGPSPSTPRTPKRLTLQEKAQKARQMRAGGASYGEISRALGVSKGTVNNYLKGYRHRR